MHMHWVKNWTNFLHLPMKGSIKAWITLVATCVWWTTSMVGSTMMPPSTMLENACTVLSLGNNPIKFTTANATKDSYSNFMVDLRRQLASENYDSYTIPVMRDPFTIPEEERYLMVQLSNSAGESITLALDIGNAYVVGYQREDQFYYFDDAPESARSLFQGSNRTNLRFRGSYDGLETAANRGRGAIEVGMPALDQAISSLFNTNPMESQHTRRTVASSLTVIIQMVSEAARFKYIEQQVRLRYISGQFHSFPPDNTMLSLENNWGALSSQIQESNEGLFSRSIALQRRDSYETFDVRRVTTDLMLNLALLLFQCKPGKSSVHQVSPLLRSTVSNDDDDDDTCSDIPEPSVRISGRNGFCVDVKGGYFNDGDPIILWSCKFNSDANQLWTLKKDKTIRSNGKCMAAYGFSPGVYVMIYNCLTANKDSILWEIDELGTIKNPHSGLVLSAKSGDAGTELTVEKDKFVPYQAWLPSNNTNNTQSNYVTSIFGLNDLCLQRTGLHNVWLEECQGGKEQNWAFYPDGTIRPELDKNTCLACGDETAGSQVVIRDCDPNSSCQRWGSRSSGVFYNYASGLVMDVRSSDPTLREILIWPYTGNPNQKWLPLL